MRKTKFETKKLKKLFQKKKVLMFNDLKEAIGTNVRMTIFRKLKELSYCTSYSHSGKYYTLNSLANYNEHGLWSFGQALFSKYGSLKNTIVTLVYACESGYFARELQEILKVNVHVPLLQLFLEAQVLRQQISNEYLYLSPKRHIIQLDNRKRLIKGSNSVDIESHVCEFESPQIKESLINFLSVLNEKQKRLYLGLESMKLGYGGDTIMSKITGMDIKTIGKGRQELQSHQITPDRIRRVGGGRKPIKKNQSSESN